jgi:hypothetical protein
VSPPFGPAQAIAQAHAEHLSPSRDWAGLCLAFARSCYGVPARHRSAATAWAAARRRRGDRKAPLGAPVWWTGGAKGYGHVALSRGDGTVWSTDVRRRGKVDVVPIGAITKAWGLSFGGWSADLNGAVVVPAVGLDAVRAAARTDPAAAQGHAAHGADVLLVERALADEGLLALRWVDGSFGTQAVAAYRRWQQRLGYRGTDADGIPGRASLTRLGRRRGFTVD